MTLFNRHIQERFGGCAHSFQYTKVMTFHIVCSIRRCKHVNKPCTIQELHLRMIILAMIMQAQCAFSRALFTVSYILNNKHAIIEHIFQLPGYLHKVCTMLLACGRSAWLSSLVPICLFLQLTYVCFQYSDTWGEHTGYSCVDTCTPSFVVQMYYPAFIQSDSKLLACII